MMSQRTCGLKLTDQSGLIGTRQVTRGAGGPWQDPQCPMCNTSSGWLSYLLLYYLVVPGCVIVAW